MLKIQFFYLMNRVSLVFLCLSSAFLTGAFLFAGRLTEGQAAMDAFREAYRLEYLTESIGVAKFVSVATALFLHIHCFLAGNGKYSAFFVSDGKSRIVFMSAKLGMAGILVGAFVLQAAMAYFLIGWYGTPYFLGSFHDAELFLWIGAEALFFGLLEALVMQLTDSVFSGILPLFLFWILELNAPDIPEGMGILYRLIPHLIWEDGDFTVRTNGIGCGLLLGGLFLMNLAIFKRRDIK